MSAAPLDVSVLGALEVRRDGTPLDLGTPKQRALVASLVLARGWPVSVDGIVDQLWGDDAPPGVTGTLQAYVSGLRRVIEPDRAPRTPATVLVTAAPGYAFKIPDERVDAHRFEQEVGRARKVLGGGSGWTPPQVDRDCLEEARATLDEALGRWRGIPYADLGDADAAVAERTRLEGLRMVALEDRAVTALALGEHATVAAELEALTAAHPLRERLWALWALALARSGRQADALDVLRRLRDVLDGELGIEPSAEVRDLQTAILRQDERLDWAAPADPVGPPRAEPAAAPAAPPEQRTWVAPWPMVGRDAELAALVGALADAESAVPAFAVLTGDPGIGKSRLAAELLLQARRRGARVLVGRCTQDEGAPPLWPWQAVLEGLGVDLVALVADQGEDEGGRFRAWERIAATVREAARQDVVAVLLDDLHWADPSSLRVLRLLVESATDERLLVVGAWRAHPAPTGALADVAEALGRRHAVRADLHGLGERDVRTVFEAVTGHAAEGERTAELLLERTDGNPFFLVELARLAAERGGGVDLAGGRLPAAVGEVLDRRLGRLPEETVAALRTAAVIGRSFDLATLADAAGLDEDDALDVVEPAQAAGLVRERGVDHYLFTHALVRDRLREGLGASRLARLHARVAAALARTPGHEPEEARHWLAAGPAHAARAWRSAVVAADHAQRLYEFEEEADLRAGALRSMDHDPTATDRDRYEVLMELVDAHRWSAQQEELVAATERAIAVAKRLRDPEAVARAAISVSHDVLWRSAPPGETNEVVVGALRGSLDRLPPGDGELRCRTLLALAIEAGDEGALAADDPGLGEALAMARRLDDPELLITAQQTAFMTRWVPSTAEDRLTGITEAVEVARRIGAERVGVVCGTLRAAVLGELGRPAEMREQLAATRAEAERMRIAYGDMVLTGLETSWLAMAGRVEDCAANLARLRALADRLDHSTLGPTIAVAEVAVSYWEGRPADGVPVLEGLLADEYPFAVPAAVHLWRAGDEAAARRVYAEHGPPPREDTQLSPYLWGMAAELSSYLGDAGLAAQALEELTPYAGRSTAVGAALVMAPVDCYLALAAATAGRADLAVRHAGDGARLAEEWKLPAVAAWFAEHRARLSC
ncbi:MAG TPA: BTAD domain-containing putative transcriptional regulator [Nocardioides sp.]|nr:BTAD domain-containing putative transcriptional regulator [Nocardioides sp.]